MAKLAFDTVELQASYGLGLQIAEQLKSSGLDSLKLEAFFAGITDIFENNQLAVPVDTLHKALLEMNQRAEQTRNDRQARLVEEGKQFLAENQKKEGVTTTESGLQFSVISQGSGVVPSATDRVRVHYTGKLVDGTVFDSSVARGEPAEFPVNGVISGWSEALTLMPVGSKWKLTIPQHLAYGERGAGEAIPPFSTLVFDVELLEIL